jgi:hypothetical protein
VEHGLDERTSVGALARMMLVGDERLSFLEGTVRRSVGPAVVEVALAGESSGGRAARAQMLAKYGAVYVSAEALVANDFHLRGKRESSVRDFRLAVDAPVRLGRTTMSSHADVRLIDRGGGASQLEAAARLSAHINRFNLATGLRYRKNYLRSGPEPPGEVNLALIGSGRVGTVRLRGATSFDVTPDARFRSAELSAYWSRSEKVDWEGGVLYDAAARRGQARVSHVRRLNAMAVAVTGEAATDGSLAVGLNLNFSLNPSGLKFSRLPLAQAGAIQARVYRDLNNNGVRDAAEPLEKGALITTGRRLSEEATDAKGSVLVGGLSAYTPVAVGIDETSLSDPMLVPRKAIQVVVPRPGVAAAVDIALVGGGDIEGAIVKSGGIGFEGLDLELVDASGKVAATARTDFDGFFLFERMPYGEYRVRLATASAQTAGLNAELNAKVVLSAAKSVVRLGAIHVEPLARIASIE